MNPLLEEYFDSVEICLIESPAVSSYTLIRREISPVDGKLRIKAELDDASLLEFFLYVKKTGGQVRPAKYSFHWQNAQGRVIKRWDNAPHHPGLDNAPHHLHIGDDAVEGTRNIPDIFFVIKQIEASVAQGTEE